MHTTFEKLFANNQCYIAEFHAVKIRAGDTSDFFLNFIKSGKQHILFPFVAKIHILKVDLLRLTCNLEMVSISQITTGEILKRLKL